MPETNTPQQNKLDQGTCEIIQGRLSKLTSDCLGEREALYNPDFNYTEFGIIKN
jgi:hypothetical protein